MRAELRYEGKRYSYFSDAYEALCNNLPNKDIYALPQSKLKGIKSYPFIYWISDEFREKFGQGDLDSTFDIRAGIQTSNNNRFLRFWWENLKEDISLFEGQIGRWVMYSKGGPFCKWYGNMWLTVDWKDKGNYLRSYLLSRNQDLHAQDYYYREGVTYSASGSKGMSFRYFPTGCLFDIGGSSIFLTEYFRNNLYLLGISNSKLLSYLTNCFNPTVNKQPNDIKRLPFEFPGKSTEEKVTILASQNVSIRRNLCTYSIIEINYESSPLASVSDVCVEIQDHFNHENALLSQVFINEALINDAVFEVYALNDHDKQMVLDKEGIPVGSYPLLSAAKTAYIDNRAKDERFPLEKEQITYIQSLTELEELDEAVLLAGFETLYQSNNDLEEFCIRHKVNPINVWYLFREHRILPAQRTQVLVFELITDVIRQLLADDDDGVIPIIERSGEEQLAIRLEQAILQRGFSAAQFGQMVEILGGDINSYLQDKFFAQLSDHLNLFMYLPKAPFIWHISSGKCHALECFVSIYKWNRDTLFRLTQLSQISPIILVLQVFVYPVSKFGYYKFSFS